MTLWDGCTNFMSPPAKFVGHRHCDSGDGMFLIFQVTRPRDQRIMCLYGWKPLKSSNHSAKFVARRHCVCVD